MVRMDNISSSASNANAKVKMLHQKCFVFFVVITHIEVGFLDSFGLTIGHTIIKVNAIRNEYKDYNLEWMPMHGLGFIVNLEHVIFCKVNVR
jgi:hypothetical protein